MFIVVLESFVDHDLKVLIGLIEHPRGTTSVSHPVDVVQNDLASSLQVEPGSASRGADEEHVVLDCVLLREPVDHLLPLVLRRVAVQLEERVPLTRAERLHGFRRQPESSRGGKTKGTGHSKKTVGLLWTTKHFGEKHFKAAAAQQTPVADERSERSEVAT